MKQMIITILLAGITTNIYPSQISQQKQNEAQAWAEYNEYTKRQEYIKSAENKIMKAIDGSDYDALKKELQNFIKEIKDADNFLVNFLNKAIYANDLTAVKMIVTSMSKREAKKVLNPESEEGPQGKFNPLWHAKLNANNGENETGQKIYDYLLGKRS